MNTLDMQFLLDTDTNPLIVFDSNSKIIYLNDSAEILMGHVSKREIFDLALKYAPKEYGAKTSRLELSFGHLNFYAVNVGYMSDEWIAIRLYYRPLAKKYSKKKSKDQIPTDVNKMLSIAINQFTIDKDVDIKLFSDTEIPATALNQNSFLKLLRKTLSLFKVNKFLDITLKLSIGDHILVDNKPRKIIVLQFNSNGRYCSEDREIDDLANEIGLISNMQESSVTFEIPLIND
jgi:hypothetical protein